MLIYNTTYHVLTADVKNFLIYVQEVLIPAIEGSGSLKNARLTRILSHHEDDSECFSLQFEVADSATFTTGMPTRVRGSMPTCSRRLRTRLSAFRP